MEAPTARRQLLAAGLAAGTLPLLPTTAAAAGLAMGEPAPFSLDMLKDMAGALAAGPFQPVVPAQADILEALDYDRHNQITYRKDAMLWADDPGAARVRFFHPGRYFKEPVEISVVEGGTARPLLFSKDLFDIPADNPARQLTEAGFAGFAVMDPEGRNDWLAVLGAS